MFINENPKYEKFQTINHSYNGHVVICGYRYLTLPEVADQVDIRKF